MCNTYNVLVNLLCFKISSVTLNKFTSSGYDDITKTWHKGVFNGNYGARPENKNLLIHILKSMKLWDSPIKIHLDLKSECGTSYSVMLLASESSILKAAKQTSGMEYQKLPWMRIPSYIIQEITKVCYLWHRTIHWIIHKEPEDVPLVEFLVLVFTYMPGESYHKWLRSLLCLCVTWLSLPHDIAVITVPYLKKPVLTTPCPKM